MSHVNVDEYRQTLLALRERVQNQVGRLREEALQKTGGEASGGLSNLPLHPADLASRQFEEDIALSLVGSEENMLGDIENALIHVDEGTFGTCEECGDPIDPERLDAVPYARQCVDCARRLQAHLLPARSY